MNSYFVRMVTIRFPGVLISTVIIAFFLMTRNDIKAQTNDSLKQLLHAEIPDSLRGKVYVQLSEAFVRRDLELSKRYLDSASQVQEYASIPIKALKINHVQGVIAQREQNFDEAIGLFQQILELTPQNREDSLLIAKTLYHMGNTRRLMNSYEDAIGYLNQSKDIFLKVGLPVKAASSDIVLGIIYKNTDQLEQAIEYYSSAHEIYQSVNNYDLMATCILNIANVYGRQGNHEDALKKFDEAYELAQKLENNEGLLGFIYGNKANAYSQLNRHDEAYENNLLAYNLRKDEAPPLEKATTLIGLSNSLRQTGRTKEALARIKEAQVMSESAEGMLEVDERIYNTLFKLYQQENQPYKAIEAANQYIQLKDSLRNLELDKKVLELNEAFETERKEKEIEILNVQNELAETKLSTAQKQTFGLLGGLLVFAGLLFVLYRLYRKTQTQNTRISRALSEKEILLREIHHRVKNNLQFISSLLGLQTEHVEDPTALGVLQEGQDRVQSMALIHQNLYQEDNLTGVEMKDYFVKLVRGLFDSYNIRKDQIALALDIEELNLDVDSVIPVGLIVNELVSNCLKYAFPGDRPGTIHVSLSEKNEELILVVSDDGVGMDKEIRENLGQSFGYRLVNVFNDQLKGIMNINSAAGTEVTIRIKKYVKSQVQAVS